MNTTKPQAKHERMPQAPRTPLPELAEFLAPLRVQFTQGPSAETLCQYVTGLLSEHPNKNCDTLAARVQGKAGPDEVVISAATQRLVAGLFETEDQGRHELKGITTPATLVSSHGSAESL
jgi:hypothetical protein